MWYNIIYLFICLYIIVISEITVRPQQANRSQGVTNKIYQFIWSSLSWCHHGNCHLTEIVLRCWDAAFLKALRGKTAGLKSAITMPHFIQPQNWIWILQYKYVGIKSRLHLKGAELTLYPYAWRLTTPHPPSPKPHLSTSVYEWAWLVQFAQCIYNRRNVKKDNAPQMTMTMICCPSCIHCNTLWCSKNKKALK